MGAAREGFDLFHKFGRQSAWRYISRGRWPSYLWLDTFGKFRCILTGHGHYVSDYDNSKPNWACRKCGKFVDAPTRVKE